jgi:hypothetical protein
VDGETFRQVAAVALTLPGVEIATRYDGSPVFKVAGRFMAGLARHASSEPGSLIVRTDPDERHWWLEEASDTFYLPEYYRPHPVVLVRLRHLDPNTLRDVLATAWRVTSQRARRARSGRR